MRATFLAEQATLGALLINPDAGAVTGKWLHTADFTDPWHAEVYATIRRLADAHRPAGAVEVGRDLCDRLGSVKADVSRIVGLLRVAPIPADVAAYAAMVVEDAVRRQVAGHGLLLRAAALSAVLDGSPQAVLTVTAIVDADLHAARARWAAAGGPGCEAHGGLGCVPRPLRTATGRDDALAADRLLRAHPEPVRAQVAEREAALIVALLARPDHIGNVVGWLRPAAVLNREWGPLYAAMVRLHERGRPIDPVTALWETQRTACVGGRGPDPAKVQARVDAAVIADPSALVLQVAGDHLRVAADSAAWSLHLAAANPGVEVVDLLDTGRALNAALREGARTLDRAGLDAGGVVATNLVRLPVSEVRRTGPVAG